MTKRILSILMLFTIIFSACSDDDPIVPDESVEEMKMESNDDDDSDGDSDDDNGNTEDDNENDEDSGTMFAIINGDSTAMEMASAGIYGVGFEFFIEGVIDNGNDFNTISLFTNSFDIGTYEVGLGVEESEASYSSAFGSAFLCGAVEGFFSIEEHDEENKRLEGTFAFDCFQGSESLSNGIFNVRYDF